MAYLRLHEVQVGKLIKFHNDIGVISRIHAHPDNDFLDRVMVKLSSGEEVLLNKYYLRGIA